MGNDKLISVVKYIILLIKKAVISQTDNQYESGAPKRSGVED